MKKKILSLFMVFAITIFNFMPINVFAAVTDIEEGGSTSSHTEVRELIENIDVSNDKTAEVSSIYFKEITVDDGEKYYDANLTVTEIVSEAIIKVVLNEDGKVTVSQVEGNKVKTKTLPKKVMNSHTFFTGVTTSGNGDGYVSVGDPDDLTNSGYIASGHAIYNYRQDDYCIVLTYGYDNVIDKADVTLTAPKVGDEVKEIDSTQDVKPTVSTTTTGLSVDAYYVKGLEELSQESFYGKFEADKDYYVLIDFEAEEGYELSSTLPDGIKVNGKAPDEVFAVFGNKWTHIVVKIKAVEPTIEPVKYEILNGADQTYTEGKDLVVRASGDLDKLTMLKVDGNELSSDNYTLKSGSTIATLKSSYLSTLAGGTHTLTFVYNDGSVDTTFTIANQTTPTNTTNNPQTGDNILLYTSIGLISLIGLSSSLIYLKRRKENA